MKKSLLIAVIALGIAFGAGIVSVAIDANKDPGLGVVGISFLLLFAVPPVISLLATVIVGFEDRSLSGTSLVVYFGLLLILAFFIFGFGLEIGDRFVSISQ